EQQSHGDSHRCKPQRPELEDLTYRIGDILRRFYIGGVDQKVGRDVDAVWNNNLEIDKLVEIVASIRQAAITYRALFNFQWRVPRYFYIEVYQLPGNFLKHEPKCGLHPMRSHAEQYKAFAR